MHDKPSLCSSCYLFRNGSQADYEKLKIASKQKTFLKYHVAGINYLGEFDL